MRARRRQTHSKYLKPRSLGPEPLRVQHPSKWVWQMHGRSDIGFVKQDDLGKKYPGVGEGAVVRRFKEKIEGGEVSPLSDSKGGRSGMETNLRDHPSSGLGDVMATRMADGAPARDADIVSAPPAAHHAHPHPSSPSETHPRRLAEMVRLSGLLTRRGFDVLVAIVVLLVLLPVLLIVAISIKLDSRGPVLFRQRRLGKDMRPFPVLKFRTMRADATSDLHARYIAELAQAQNGHEASELKKLTNDPRVTRVGRVLRRLSIDEVPQLLNVVAGQMGLVGPRPAIDYEIQHYEPLHFERFNVRPGITGLWQVSGRSAIGFKEMLDLDAQYATTATLGADLRILARTPRAAVRNAA